MEREHTSPERPIQGNAEAAEVAVDALLLVYDSRAQLTRGELTSRVAQLSNFDRDGVATVVNKLFDGEIGFLKQSSDPKYQTMLGSAGLWVIQDIFSTEVNESDTMALAQKQLRGFLSELAPEL